MYDIMIVIVYRYTFYNMNFSKFLPDEPPPAPTLLDLILFEGEKRIINIPQEIGKKYFTFGMLLLKDPNAHRITAIEFKWPSDLVRMNTEILQEWVQGKGASLSWQTLVDTLEKVELSEMAKEIRDVKL